MIQPMLKELSFPSFPSKINDPTPSTLAPFENRAFALAALRDLPSERILLLRNSNRWLKFFNHDSRRPFLHSR
jgi:hypothetical protein